MEFERPSKNREGASAKNIATILSLEKIDRKELGLADRLSHQIAHFVGTVYFVLFECLLVLLWLAVNVGPLKVNAAFDPYPFPLLSVVLTLEAVLLTSFVLIRQSALNLQSERRNHLELQINMLAEEEATESLKILRLIAQRLNVDDDDYERSAELAEKTPVQSIARDLKARQE
jgi:uncharacterized membrane protein